MRGQAADDGGREDEAFFEDEMAAVPRKDMAMVLLFLRGVTGLQVRCMTHSVEKCVWSMCVFCTICGVFICTYDPCARAVILSCTLPGRL